jgi:hypothetical protein
MNWDAIGAIGEIVGAFAVVLSLVYLAVQIRTQNKEARLASMHDTVAAQRESMRTFLEPNVSEDFIAVIEGFDEADPAQRLRFTMVTMIALKANQDAYLQFLGYRLGEDFFQPYGAQLADMMANESTQRVWKLRKHQFDERFRDYVDKLEIGKQIYL